MIGCSDFGANVELYLDKELSGRELEEFRSHLEECETCRADLMPHGLPTPRAISWG